MKNSQESQFSSSIKTGFVNYPLLILHGWGSKAAAWKEVADFLENDGYKVIVPDLPGFGQNPAPEKPWGIDEYVDWVDDFVQKNNLSRFFLLGHSFGGGLAVKYSVKFPEKVEKLFLVAAAFARKKTAKRFFFSMLSKILKIFAFLPFYNLARKAFYKFIIRKSDYIYTEGVMKESYLKIINQDLSDELALIQTPTIIIWGEKDDVTPVKWAYFAKEKMELPRACSRGASPLGRVLSAAKPPKKKNPELVIIEDGDHDLERKMPEVLAEKIKNFLR